MQNKFLYLPTTDASTETFVFLFEFQNLHVMASCLSSDFTSCSCHLPSAAGSPVCGVFCEFAFTPALLMLQSFPHSALPLCCRTAEMVEIATGSILPGQHHPGLGGGDHWDEGAHMESRCGGIDESGCGAPRDLRSEGCAESAPNFRRTRVADEKLAKRVSLICGVANAISSQKLRRSLRRPFAIQWW